MRYTVTIQEDDAGEAFIELPPEILQTFNLTEGSLVNYNYDSDGSIIVTFPTEEE